MPSESGLSDSQIRKLSSCSECAGFHALSMPMDEAVPGSAREPATPRATCTLSIIPLLLQQALDALGTCRLRGFRSASAGPRFGVKRRQRSGPSPHLSEDNSWSLEVAVETNIPGGNGLQLYIFNSELLRFGVRALAMGLDARVRRPCSSALYRSGALPLCCDLGSDSASAG